VPPCRHGRALLRLLVSSHRLPTALLLVLPLFLSF
jgi:hypothetical protein